MIYGPSERKPLELAAARKRRERRRADDDLVVIRDMAVSKSDAWFIELIFNHKIREQRFLAVASYLHWLHGQMTGYAAFIDQSLIGAPHTLSREQADAILQTIRMQEAEAREGILNRGWLP